MSTPLVGPVPGVALIAATLVVYVVWFFRTMARNVPASRAVAVALALAHGGAIFAATGRPLLALGPALCGSFCLPWEAPFRRVGWALASILPIGIALGLIVTLASWPLDLWTLAAAPMILFQTIGATQIVPGHRDIARKTPASWSVKIGDEVPDLTVPAQGGQPEFRLSQERGRHILLFLLRGNWCPVCHIVVRIYQRQAPALAKADIKLVVVTPTPGGDAVAFLQTFGLDQRIVTDPELLVARHLGAVHHKGWKGEDVPLPAAFLIDDRGILRHATKPTHITDFLEAEQIVAALS